MLEGLRPEDWELLKSRIELGNCTPFLGAGVSAGRIPLGSVIAKEWADEFKYPLPDKDDLAKVAQYIAVRHGDAMFPKEEFLRSYIASATEPDFSSPGEPYGILASLELPVYMTTNYDDFMFRALQHAQREPQLEYCRWNDQLTELPTIFDSDSGFQPSPEKPVVFHLHGHKGLPESMVLTEDDYLDFIVHVSRDSESLPKRIQRALTGTSLVFIGYSLKDWSFRVLFRGLIMSMERSLRRCSVTVQLRPESPDEQMYIDEYYRRLDMRVFWGTAEEFVEELVDHCRRGDGGQ